MTIGEARLESILGGRFLREENSGMSAGRPVERLKIWGYDNAKQQYVSVWMYTMETGVLMLTGTSPDGGKTLEFTAELPQPAGPGVQMLYVTVRDAEHGSFVMEVGGIDGQGQRSRVEETTYTRRD